VAASRKYRRYSNKKTYSKKFGGKPSPAQLHKQMNKIPKTKEKPGSAFEFILVATKLESRKCLADIHESGIKNFKEILRKEISAGNTYDMFADIPKKPGLAVFIIKNEGDKKKVYFTAVGLKVQGSFTWVRREALSQFIAKE
jgi:hypothetical protein